MPIYEFKCQDCDLRFEEILRSSSQRLKPTCPKFKTRDVFRVMSGFAAGGSARRAGSSCGSCKAKSCAGCKG